MIPERPKGPKEISYLISIFSTAEMKKVKNKCKLMNESAQILTKIVKTLKAQLIVFEDYTMMYYISCILSKPGLSLAGQEDFDGLMKCMKGMPSKILIMNIIVVQVAQTPKESAAVLPGNEKKIKNIWLLHDKWICKKPDSACPSTHCYVLLDTEEHFPHGHEHFDCWAAAMSKNDNGVSCAALNKPPNHHLFDVKKLSLSPASALTASAPVFNFMIRNELASFFHPQIPPPVPSAQLAPISSEENGMLIPSGCATGFDMLIIHFCLAYQLDDSIAEKFVSHSLKEACLLCFVHFVDLKDMGFKFREIAALHDAIEKWSTPAV
ncbi:hypothetical protein V8B97DRAFT_2020674 [Scleroderma yunnanense]